MPKQAIATTYDNFCWTAQTTLPDLTPVMAQGQTEETAIKRLEATVAAEKTYRQTMENVENIRSVISDVRAAIRKL